MGGGYTAYCVWRYRNHYVSGEHRFFKYVCYIRRCDFVGRQRFDVYVKLTYRT